MEIIGSCINCWTGSATLAANVIAAAVIFGLLAWRSEARVTERQ